MVCLLNTRFLEERDGWKFFGNYKACESGWYPFAGHCYYLNETKVTWKAAKTQCTVQNSYLVEVNSAKEYKWISEMFLSENGNGNNTLITTTWIGARRKNDNVTWVQSNEPVLQSWVASSLDGRGNCVFMKYTGHWIDVSCGSAKHLHASVCEKMV
ncbi:C-type lectin domain family 4 member G-like [Saccostrea cucullata]|uniref:C-type lectin domain family 4 member G-like n=1 Tax=Saccostrea cuccullata TaxID=36930 RepID=UPI002ED03485